MAHGLIQKKLRGGYPIFKNLGVVRFFRSGDIGPRFKKKKNGFGA
jgi:hypothetical protein